MKKILFIVLILSAFGLKAQYGTPFFRGFGIFGAITESAHYYTNSAKDLSQVYYPPAHISKEYFNWGVGAFAEFLKSDNLRWQTELEYVKKGAKEKEIIDVTTGDRASNWGVNKYTYFQWNNYLKFYNPIGFGSHWYIMPGIRLEYLFRSSASVFTPVSGDFPTFWFSGNIGAGYEFPLFKKFSGIVEYHWNPDIIPHAHDNIKVRNRTFELRLGIMWRPKQRSIDDCNTPRYNGPAY